MPIEDITCDKCRELLGRKEDLEIIDVREPNEYEVIRVRHSKLIPLRELSSRLDEINWDKEVVFICRSGNRSRSAAQAVALRGKSVKNLSGGLCGCYGKGGCDEIEILADRIKEYFC